MIPAMESEVAFLRKMPVFEDLEPQELSMIAKITVYRRFNKDEVIFTEGSQGEGFHFIRSGRIKILKSSADGREHILNILGTGEVFAEVLLFNAMPYPATALALEAAEVGMIRNRELEALLLDYPRIAVHIIRVMSRKLQYIQSRIKILALADSQTKVAQTLGYLAGRYGQQQETDPHIVIEINRQDLADMAGTTRETVSRVLRVLKDEGVVRDEERKLVIMDIRRLKEYYEIN